MSIVDTVVSVTISRNTTAPSRAGFGTPGLVAYHNFWPQMLRGFSSGADVVAAVVAGGGVEGHVICREAQLAFSQEIAPKTLVIAKRLTAFVQVVTLTIKNATVGYVYDFDVILPTGVRVPITYTVLAAATTSTVATAVAALIDTATGASGAAAAVAAVITHTSVSGVVVAWDRMPPITVIGVADTTADPGIAADLTAIENAEKLAPSLQFYGVAFDQTGKLTNAAAATWMLSRIKFALLREFASEIFDPSDSDDTASVLVSSSNDRCFVMPCQRASHDARDIASLAARLPYEPGQYTFAFIRLKGITPDTLSSEERAAALAKRACVFESGGGFNITFEGQTGEGTFADTIIELDFVAARVKEDLYAWFASQKKVPYTQIGIEATLNVAQNRLDRCTKEPNPIFDAFSVNGPPTVEAILLEDVSSDDKNLRKLTNVKFRATLQGAINRVTVIGTVGT